MDKIYFEALGCDKNRVDLEKALHILVEKGYLLTDNKYEAQIIIINTCAFIDSAKDESFETINELKSLKKDGKCNLLIVLGCLSQISNEEIKSKCPEVDIILGAFSADKILKAIEDYKQETISIIESQSDNYYGKGRIITASHNYEYLKIADGCSKGCAYCAIPLIRGKYRSYDIDDLVEEAKGIAKAGIKELIVVAQETTLYGVDLYGKKMLPTLLKRLCEIEEFKMIRIMYTYPEEITDELIEVIKNNSKICNYIDMPIQHINNDILKAMGRRATKEDIISTINKLRENIPDIILRTTLLTGFPGETDEAHDELIEFIKDIKFDRLGAFKFSPQKGTKAYTMPGKVSENQKEKWYNDIMSVQQEVVFEKMTSFIGKEIDVMIEGHFSKSTLYLARGYMDAPDIDSFVFIDTDKDLQSGDFVKVKITNADGYDLIGEII